MNERILFVDDDTNILDGFQRTLRRVLNVHTAQGPHVGLRTVTENGPFAVVVADFNMPLMNGVEFLKKVKELSPNTVRMMLTGNANINVAMDAVNEGSVFRFLAKPCPSKLMADALVAAISQYRLIVAEEELLKGTLTGVVDLMTEILSWISPGLFTHALQLRKTVKSIVSELKVEQPWEVELAAALSQIGLLTLPQETLTKVSTGETLSPEDEKALANVPHVGYELLSRIPRLDKVAEIVLHQREGLAAEKSEGAAAIPLGAHILNVAIDYHQLRSLGTSCEDSRNLMMSRKDRYRPDVLAAFLATEKPSDAGYEARNVVGVPVRELKSGHLLHSPIYSSDGRHLVGENTTITGPLLVRLRELAKRGGIREPIQIVLTA